MTLVQDDDVIKQLSTKATYHSLHIGVLPRRGRGRDHVIDTERLNPTSNPLTVKGIAVS